MEDPRERKGNLTKEEVEAFKQELYWQAIRAGKCPECDEPLVYESGCMTCYHCGWSACS